MTRAHYYYLNAPELQTYLESVWAQVHPYTDFYDEERRIRIVDHVSWGRQESQPGTILVDRRSLLRCESEDELAWYLLNLADEVPFIVTFQHQEHIRQSVQSLSDLRDLLRPRFNTQFARMRYTHRGPEVERAEPASEPIIPRRTELLTALRSAGYEWSGSTACRWWYRSPDEHLLLVPSSPGRERLLSAIDGIPVYEPVLAAPGGFVISGTRLQYGYRRMIVREDNLISLFPRFQFPAARLGVTSISDVNWSNAPQWLEQHYSDNDPIYYYRAYSLSNDRSGLLGFRWWLEEHIYEAHRDIVSFLEWRNSDQAPQELHGQFDIIEGPAMVEVGEDLYAEYAVMRHRLPTGEDELAMLVHYRLGEHQDFRFWMARDWSEEDQNAPDEWYALMAQIQRWPYPEELDRFYRRVLGIHVVEEGETVTSIASQMAYSVDPVAEFLRLNGLSEGAVLMPGDLVKTIQVGHMAPSTANVY